MNHSKIAGFISSVLIALILGIGMTNDTSTNRNNKKVYMSGYNPTKEEIVYSLNKYENVSISYKGFFIIEVNTGKLLANGIPKKWMSDFILKGYKEGVFTKKLGVVNDIVDEIK